MFRTQVNHIVYKTCRSETVAQKYTFYSPPIVTTSTSYTISEIWRLAS